MVIAHASNVAEDSIHGILVGFVVAATPPTER